MLLMYARVKLFIIYLHTFEIPDFVRFQSSENGFLFSQPVRPLVNILSIIQDFFKCPLDAVQIICVGWGSHLPMVSLLKI